MSTFSSSKIADMRFREKLKLKLENSMLKRISCFELINESYFRCLFFLVVRNKISEEESYSVELAEIEYRVFLSLAKEASTFSAVYQSRQECRILYNERERHELVTLNMNSTKSC